jgi:glycosyltransferase involved in cell wall biosynthesis
MTSKHGAAAQRILFLGKRFYTNKDAWTERFGRVFRLPSEWARSGADVLLWLVDYHTRQPLDVREGGLSVASTPVLGLAMVKTMVRAIRFRPAVIVASGDCYIGFLGWLLARCMRARFVFDIYDKYDEFAGYHRPLGLDLFGFLRRRADLRFYPSRSLAQLYRAESGGRGDEIVTNGVDDRLFRPLPMAECRQRLGLDPGIHLVGYFGGMEPDRGVADLIAAIQLLRKEREDVRLLVCGKEHISTPLSHDWIIYRGMVSHPEMPLYLNASDVLAIPYRLSAFMDMGASCKIAEYLMCERPIVSTRTPNFVVNFPLQAQELGPRLCAAEDIPGLAKAINLQLHTPKLLTVPVEMVWSKIAASALDAIQLTTSKAAA